MREIAIDPAPGEKSTVFNYELEGRTNRTIKDFA